MVAISSIVVKVSRNAIRLGLSTTGHSITIRLSRHTFTGTLLCNGNIIGTAFRRVPLLPYTPSRPVNTPRLSWSHVPVINYKKNSSKSKETLV